jgi:hypothetical protein
VDSRERSVDFSRLDLPVLDLSDLETAWSEDEVWKVIKSIPTDKAPAPMVCR